MTDTDADADATEEVSTPSQTDEQEQEQEPFAAHTDRDITELSDYQLYEAYNHAKQFGPTLRLDELQLEVAQRWEQQFQVVTEDK